MKTAKYITQINKWPVAGKQVLGRLNGDILTVYQAFNPHIAEWAVKHGQFGGPHYSFNRMSWSKPGFLWMMYRAGWAVKENQQKILAVSLPLEHFKTILQQATITSFDPAYFPTRDEWQEELGRTEVRLQWDPDHDPYGKKQERKAIQIGMRGAVLKQFCTAWITGIEDITPFVKAQHQLLLQGKLDELELPLEEVIDLGDPVIEKRIGIKKV